MHLIYLSTSLFEEFKSFLNEITKREFLALAVVNEVTDVRVVVLVQIEDRQDLSVVWHLIIFKIRRKQSHLWLLLKMYLIHTKASPIMSPLTTSF